MTSIFTSVKGIINKLTGDSVTMYAAQASFYIIISGVPFAYLLITILTALMGSYGKIIGYIELFLPRELTKLVYEAVAVIDNTRDLKLLSFSAAALMWTASGATRAVERGVARVYRVGKRRGMLKNIIHSVVYTLALIMIIALSLVLLVLGEYLTKLAAQIIFKGAVIPSGVHFLRALGALFMLLIIFLVLYHSFSQREHKPAVHIPGSLFTGLGWMVLSKLYSVYVVIFSRRSYIYGGFAAAVLFMLWIYACMIIFLLGAELNVIIKDWRLK